MTGHRPISLLGSCHGRRRSRAGRYGRGFDLGCCSRGGDPDLRTARRTKSCTGRNL